MRMERPAIRLDFVWAYYRRGILLFNCISHIEIEYRIQPEKFRLQADVFAGILCRTTFDISFCFMDGKISCKTLTMPPNEVAGAIRRRDSYRESAGGSTFYVMRH